MKLSAAILVCITLLCCSSSCKEASSRDQPDGSQHRRTQAAVHDSIQIWKGGDNYVAVVYVAPGECTKCDLVTSHAVAWIRDRAPDTRIVAVVKCRRLIELNRYIETNDFMDHAAMNQRGLWGELGGEPDSRMLVFDKAGRLRGNIRSAQFFGNTDSVLAEIFKNSPCL